MSACGLACSDSMAAVPSTLVRYTSSPNVSKKRDQSGWRPTSSTGEKFHPMPLALISYAVICPARRTSMGFHVAAMAIFCGKMVPPSMYWWPWTPSMP